MKQGAADESAHRVTQDTDQHPRRNLVVPAFCSRHRGRGSGTQYCRVGGCQQFGQGEVKPSPNNEQTNEVNCQQDSHQRNQDGCDGQHGGNIGAGGD